MYLSFRRWLTVATNDMATIEVSPGSNQWTQVWSSQSNEYADASWEHSMVEISSVAAGQTNVSIRWTMGPTDSQDVEGGWNLDEVRVLHIW